MRKYKPTYFISQAFKGMRRNGMMTAASVTVLLSCLIVIGCFFMLLVNLNRNLQSLGELNEIVAFVYSDQKYKDGDSRPTPDTLESEGNTFLGWSTDPDSNEAQILPGQEYIVSASDAVADVITLYAVWENKAQYEGFKVNYHTLGIAITEEIANDETVYQLSDIITLPTSVIPKNSAIKFLGWSLSPDGEGTVISSGSCVVSESDVKGGQVTFYAVWDQMPTYNEYSVVYSANGVEAASVPTDSGLILKSVSDSLNALNNIESISFISKSDALEEEIEKYKDYPGLQQFLKEGNNPLPDTYVITYGDISSVEALELQIQNIDGVSRVKCRTDIAQSIENLKSGIIVVFSWFMIILFVVSIFVIINTIKLAVEHRSKEISIMRYIGATRWFIVLPFDLEGIVIGLFSGGLAFLVQWYAYGYIQDMITSDMKMIEVVPFSDIKIILLVGCLVIGVLTGIIGSRISISKHLKD